jgi:hypothetical protein
VCEVPFSGTPKSGGRTHPLRVWMVTVTAPALQREPDPASTKLCKSVRAHRPWAHQGRLHGVPKSPCSPRLYMFVVREGVGRSFCRHTPQDDCRRLIARNAGHDLVFVASCRDACSHSDLGGCADGAAVTLLRGRQHGFLRVPRPGLPRIFVRALACRSIQTSGGRCSCTQYVRSTQPAAAQRTPGSSRLVQITGRILLGKALKFGTTYRVGALLDVWEFDTMAFLVLFRPEHLSTQDSDDSCRFCNINPTVQSTQHQEYTSVLCYPKFGNMVQKFEFWYQKRIGWHAARQGGSKSHFVNEPVPYNIDFENQLQLSKPATEQYILTTQMDLLRRRGSV